jgi:PAS domain S-box-containing protein
MKLLSLIAVTGFPIVGTIKDEDALNLENIDYRITELQGRLALLSKQVKQGTSQNVQSNREMMISAYEDMTALLAQIQGVNDQVRDSYIELAVIRQGLESERLRYLSLFNFAPDGYLVTSQDGIILEANQTASLLIKLPADNLSGQSLAEYVIEAERAAFSVRIKKIDPHERVQDWEVTLQPENGVPFPASLNVASIPGEAGKSDTLLWLVRNISRRKGIEASLQKKTAQLKLLQEIGFSANEAATLESVLQLAVDRICTYTGWPVGHIYLRSSESASELVSTDIWHLDQPEKYQVFRTATEHTNTSPGIGLPGQVLENGEPKWITDVTKEPSFFPLLNVSEQPVRAGMFFPILVGKVVAGVLEFFSGEVVEPDPALLELMGQIGTQLGRVVERKLAEEKIHEREELIQSAISVAPMVFFILDCQGMVRLTLGNQQVYLFSNPEAERHSLYELAQDQPPIIENFQQALSGKTTQLVIKLNETVYEIHFAPLRNSGGDITGVVSVASDITSRRKVEEALQKSEERFRTIFQEAGLGIDLVDFQGNLIEFNPAFQAMMGYSSDELHKMTFSDLYHPADLDESLQLFQELITGKRDRYQIERRYIRKDGGIVWGRVAISSVGSIGGEPQYAIAMVENITAKKQMEAELAELERRLIDRREIDRLQLAQELHDGPLQDLHSAIYQLNPFQEWIKDDAGLLQLKGAQGTLYQIIDTVRNICKELRPPALAPFGLEKAIRSHAGQIQEMHPELQIALDLVSDRQSLPEHVRLALFRIYQNALANVIRHANARHILIHFDMDTEQIILDIQDDGQGFKVPTRWIEWVRQGHFGLVGSAERAAALGGRLTIESQPGQGAAVRVVIPRQEERQASRAERLSTKIKE